MAGYSGQKMSNNAIEAYKSRKMPLSKWKKTDIIERIEVDLREYKSEEILPIFNKMKKEELMDFLKCCEYHHTGKYYNRTNFYEIDYEAVENFVEKHQELKYIFEIEDGVYLSSEKNSNGKYYTTNKDKARRMCKYEAEGYMEFGGNYIEVIHAIR